MELQVRNITGKAVKTIKLPESIFAVPMNEHVLHTAVKAYLANMRQGTAATRTKANVSGGGKKPFKQKGTGGARQGSSRSPLQPGGGVAHGPQPRCHRQKLNNQVKRLALAIALSDKERHGKLVVVDDFGVTGFSTSYVIKALGALSAPKALLSDERKDNLLYRSARNIHGADVLPPSEINAADVLRYESLVISETALHSLQQRFEETTRESV